MIYFGNHISRSPLTILTIMTLGLGLQGCASTGIQAENDTSDRHESNSSIPYIQEQLKTESIATSPIAPSKISQNNDVRLVISAFPLNEIKKLVGSMLDGVKEGNEAEINTSVIALNQIAHPARGDRKTARSYNVKGIASIRQGAFNEAVSLIAVAAKTDPADQEIIDNLSFALLKNANLEEARLISECALSLAPKRASAWANLGTVLAQENKEGSAVASFILTFRFSTNLNKTREYFKGLIGSDAPFTVQRAASMALSQVGSP